MGKAVCNFSVKVLFLLCISFVAFEAYMNGADGKADKVVLVVLIAVSFAVLVLTKYLARRYLKFFDKNFIKILAAYLLVLTAVQIFCGIHLRYEPMWDLDSVYGGAICWLENGTIDAYQDYFYYFPNNLGLLVFFRAYFGLLHLFLGNGMDYFVAAVVICSIMITIFRLSVVWIAKKLLGTEYGVVMMVLLLLCVPLYFAAAVFYTDVMSMAAPPLIYLLYLYSREEVSWRGKIFLYVEMAFVAAIGMEIKFTVLIIVIAIGIEMLLQGKWKNCLCMAAIHLAVICAMFGAVGSVVYSGLLEKEQAEKQNTPYLHWVMMGAKGNGSYDGDDYVFTRQFTDREAQDAALKAEIARRYRELGLDGLMDLWKAKTIKCFGDGTYALSDFLDDSPQNDTSWNDWILYSGKNYDDYRTICLGGLVSVMLLMLFGIAGNLGTRREGRVNDPAIWLSFLGIWIFLMFWETSARYFMNLLSVMLVAALIGLPHMERWVKRVCRKIRASWRAERQGY
jgi:hypothetical protein